jgi:hypothetical protein
MSLPRVLHFPAFFHYHRSRLVFSFRINLHLLFASIHIIDRGSRFALLACLTVFHRGTFDHIRRCWYTHEKKAGPLSLLQEEEEGNTLENNS